jgi:hypothetical protein
MVSYFVAVVLFSYLGLLFLGTRSVLVEGLPALMLVRFTLSMLPGLVASSCLNFLLFVLISYCTNLQPLERIEAFHRVIHKNL